MVAMAVVGFLISQAGCSKWNERGRKDVVSGTIETDESHVASRYGGRVETITAREGEMLKPGQVFIRLDAAELQARYALAKSQLAELKAGPRKEEIEAAKNDWESAMAELEFARSEAKRMSESFQQKTVSASERARAVSHLQSPEKSVAAPTSRYDLLRAGPRQERIDQAEAQVGKVGR